MNFDGDLSKFILICLHGFQRDGEGAQQFIVLDRGAKKSNNGVPCANLGLVIDGCDQTFLGNVSANDGPASSYRILENSR